MTNSTTLSLTDRALERLKKLAEGNGLAPDAIRIMGAEEKIYPLEGMTKLELVVETQASRYPGRVRGKAQAILPSFAGLRAAVEQRQKNWKEEQGWVPAALLRLKEQAGEGWGLDNVRIDLPGN